MAGTARRAVPRLTALEWGTEKGSRAGTQWRGGSRILKLSLRMERMNANAWRADRRVGPSFRCGCAVPRNVVRLAHIVGTQRRRRPREQILDFITCIIE